MRTKKNMDSTERKREDLNNLINHEIDLNVLLVFVAAISESAHCIDVETVFALTGHRLAQLLFAVMYTLIHL